MAGEARITRSSVLSLPAAPVPRYTVCRWRTRVRRGRQETHRKRCPLWRRGWWCEERGRHQGALARRLPPSHTESELDAAPALRSRLGSWRARAAPPGACGARTQPPCPRAPHTLHRPRSSQRCALCACRLAPCLPRMYIPPAPRTRTAPGCPAVCLSGCLAPSGLHEHPPMCNTQVHNARDSFATNRLVGHGGGRARTREDGCGREGCRRGAGQMLAQATCPAEEASACPPVGTRRLQPCWQRHRPTFWAGGPTGSGPGGPGPRSPGPGWPPRRSLLP